MNDLTDIQKFIILDRQRNNLSEFIRRVFSIISPSSIYKHNWHIDCIAEYLVACQKGKISRLIINIPPRFLKSISVSVAFPAWLLGHNPVEQIMCASYSKDLAMKHGTDCRNVIRTDWYNALFPKVKLAADQNTKSKFRTIEGGVRYSVGVGGTITGEGGDFIIIDDALSARESNSKVVREATNNWFSQTAYTRLNDKKTGVMIVMMQRLHHNDLTGYLLEQGGWEHLKIPLIAEGKQLYQINDFRKEVEEGELLSPNQMGEIEIAELKRRLGPYNFAGQYMQNPSPTGGGRFKREWLQFYKGTLEHSTMNIYITVDPANSKRDSADFTAICVFGLGNDENIYILEMIRDKLNIRERQEELFRLHKKYKPKLVIYEKYGMQVDTDAMREAMEYTNYRFSITEVGGSLNKEDRIERLIPYFSDGRIWLPEIQIKASHEGKAIDIVEEFIHQEYLTFPVGLNDDFLDSMSRLFEPTISLMWPGKYDFNYHEFAKGFK